jgi:hypothetical protein
MILINSTILAPGDQDASGNNSSQPRRVTARRRQLGIILANGRNRGSPPTESLDSKLLFAVLVPQRRLVDQNKFVEVCTAWAGRPDTPLLDLSSSAAGSCPTTAAKLEEDVARLAKKHQGRSASLAVVEPFLRSAGPPARGLLKA